MRLFFRSFPVTTETRILDVGGSPAIWEFAPVRPRITFANLPSAVDRGRKDGLWVAADGCLLPFRDREFDIAFSNSVIEHVGSAENQRRFASEMARVAKSYWVQTPNRRALVEMHSMLPLVHFMPKRWQAALIRRFSPWQWIARPTPEQKEFFFAHVLHDLRLLNGRELGALFSDAKILHERFAGLPKSLIATRRFSA